MWDKRGRTGGENVNFGEVTRSIGFYDSFTIFEWRVRRTERLFLPRQLMHEERATVHLRISQIIIECRSQRAILQHHPSSVMASRPERVEEADACMYATPSPTHSHRLSDCLLELVIVVSVDDRALLVPHAIRADTPPLLPLDRDTRPPPQRT